MYITAVLWIRIQIPRIHVFLGLLDPDPDPLVIGITIIRNCVEFNAKLKEHFLNQLSYTVNCTKSFCPSCNRFLNP